MIFLTSPGKTYSVNSVGGCTISAGGTTLATIPANVQTTFIAPEEEVLVSDDNAIIVEVTGVGAGGSGGSGEGGGGGTEVPSLKFEVVDVLPETGEDGIIYLVPTGETGDNKYEEWVWVNGSYEQMGTASLDLSGFAVLDGGNTFTGDQTIEGDVTVSGDVTTSDEFLREAQIYLPAAIPSEMVSGRVYDLGVINSNQDLSSIAFKSAPGYVQTCEIWMETGDTGYTVTWPTGSVWPDEPNGAAPSFVLPVNKRYRFAVRNEGNGTMVITKAYEYSV